MKLPVPQQESEKPNRDLSLLCPQFLTKLELALGECHGEGHQVYVFEAFRPAKRQEHLYAQGRTAEGRLVTRAKPWLSWHQYGLAADIVFKVKNEWSWDYSFQDVARIMSRNGLEWGGLHDQVHFQITGGIDIKDAFYITREYGLQTLWQAVFKKIELRYK